MLRTSAAISMNIQLDSRLLVAQVRLPRVTFCGAGEEDCGKAEAPRRLYFRIPH